MQWNFSFIVSVVLVAFGGAVSCSAAAPAIELADVQAPPPAKLAQDAYAVYREHAGEPVWRSEGVQLLAPLGLVECLNGKPDIGRARFAEAEALAAARELHRRLGSRTTIARFQSAAGLTEDARATLRRGIDDLEAALEFGVPAVRMLAQMRADADVERLLKVYQPPRTKGGRAIRWPHCDVVWAVELHRRGEADRAKTVLRSIAAAAPQSKAAFGMALAVAYAQLKDDAEMRRHLGDFAEIVKGPPAIGMLYVACVRTMVRQGRRDDAVKLWESRPSGLELDSAIVLRYALEVADIAQAAPLARTKPAVSRVAALLLVARVAARTKQRQSAEALLKEVEAILQAAPPRAATIHEKQVLDVARVRLAGGDLRALPAAAEAINDPAQKAFAYAAAALEIQVRRGAKVPNILIDGEHFPYSIEE